MSKPLPGPLAGIKVVEFGQNLAGPYCGQILAFLGADVVKVERPEGDDARKWAPPFWHGMSALFQSLNRNKQSVVVDLRNIYSPEEVMRNGFHYCGVGRPKALAY